MNLYYCSLYYKNDHVTGANKRFDEIGIRLLGSNTFNLVCIVTTGNRPVWCPKEKCIEICGFKSKFQRLRSWVSLSFLLWKLPKGIIYNDFQPKPTFFALKRHKHFQLIHDLRNFDKFKRGGLGVLSAFFQKTQLKYSQNVVSVSNYTTELVESFCSKSRESIITSYNGISGSYEGGDKNREIDLLYIATYEERKNHIRLLEALSGIKFKKLNIVFVGSDLGLKNQVIDMANSISASVGHSFKFLDQISEELLIETYKNSKIFCSPSLYEGFGMPLIEAYKYGCLVVCSDIKVFREVTLNEAVYFEPTDVDDIKSTLESSFLNYDGLLNSEHAKKVTNYFSWDAITKRLIKDLNSNEFFAS